MTKIRTSLYVEESVDMAVSEMASKSASTEGVPELSKSEIYRKLIQDGLEQNGNLLDLLGKTDRILYQRERHVEREAKLQSLRAGFEARCVRHCKNRFEDGIRLSEVDSWADGLKRDAQILWPEDDERRHDALEYVQNLTESMKEAIEYTDYDPLDPEEVFSAYTTVSEALDDGDALEKREEILAEYRRRREASGQAVQDLEAISKAIADKYGLEQGSVRLVIEEADRNDTPGFGGEADD